MNKIIFWFCFMAQLFNTVSAQISGSITDIDGNIYNYVTFDTLQWTTSDANMVTYTDGTPIPEVTDEAAWFTLATGAWCYYNNDSTNGEIYGKLYNAYAMMGRHDNDPNTPDKELAPEGWRVPSDEDWAVLELYLGMESPITSLPAGSFSSSNEGSKLAGNDSLWFNNPDNCSGGGSVFEDTLINDSQFNVTSFNWLPGGYRNGAWSSANQSFCFINEGGYLWSNSLSGSGYPRFRMISHNSTGMGYSSGIFTFGRGVRFVRDYVITSVSDLSFNAVNMFPNPAKGIVNFSSASNEVLNVAIYDMLGKEVMSPKEVQSQLNISSLNPGLYFVKMNQGGNFATKKLLVE